MTMLTLTRHLEGASGFVPALRRAAYRLSLIAYRRRLCCDSPTIRHKPSAISAAVRPLQLGCAGFTLAELLVTLSIAGAVVAGVGTVFTTQSRVYKQQEQQMMVEQNLRVSMGMVTDALRMAGCGVPAHLLADWIPTSGFSTGPIAIQDGGGAPDTLSVAACTPEVSTISANAAANTTTLSASSTFPGHALTEMLNADDKRLIWIGEAQHALVRGIGANSITIDTDPTKTGNQGLLRLARAGTPIIRIDVSTFAVQTDGVSGRSWLSLDQHHGAVQAIAEGVTNLQIVPVTAGRQYQVTLTARSELPDPVSGVPFTRSLTAEVVVRN